MIYKNIDVHNVAEIIETKDGMSWKRFPKEVCAQLELDTEQRWCTSATGVELRFVIKDESVTLRMACSEDDKNRQMLDTFHVYRGGIQGGWEDHITNKYVSSEAADFVIKRSANMDTLKKMNAQAGYDWDPEVVRVIFNRGHYRIVDIVGDVEPPHSTQTPKKTLLTYGSSITHGDNSYNQSNAWASVLAHRMKMDLRNLGMAGTCAIEPAVIDYIAAEGERGNWDMAILELGINVLWWEEEKFRERVVNAIEQVAGRNPLKPVLLISPFYCDDDFKEGGKAENWRRIMAEVAAELSMPNVTLINGLDLIGDMSLISADEIHPNIYGMQQIADRLLEICERNSLLL